MKTDTHIDGSAEAPERTDLERPDLYLNRELALLSYFRRILHEAENDAAPLLERVAFLASFSEQLDNFFSERVAILRRQLAVAPDTLSIDGRTSEQQLEACRDHVQVYIADEAFVWFELCYLLAKEGIHLFDVASLADDKRAWLAQHWRERIRPLLTPMAVDMERAFPWVAPLRLHAMIEAREPASGSMHVIRVELPISRHLPRFVRVGDSNTYVPLEQVVMAHVGDLLPGAEIRSSGLFRVTHDTAAYHAHHPSADLFETLPGAVRDALPDGRCVRLEVSDELPAHVAGYIAGALGLNAARDVYRTNALIAARDLYQIAALPIARLRYPPTGPTAHPRLAGASSIVREVADNGPVFLHHPYQGYEHTVMPLLREAAGDPRVVAIKATVPRRIGGSGLLAPLIMAARAGKHVAIVAQDARHGDAADEKWARYLASNGVTVSFGPRDYAPNAHAILIVRSEENGSLGRTVHVASGYHDPGRQKPDADVGLISAESDLADEIGELFNMMTSGLLPGRRFDALLIAPQNMKEGLIQRIDRERKLQGAGGKGIIAIKANSLCDIDITRALYAAGRAGVHIDLIVRADCRLRPGMPGLTDNVRVVSVLGRYREHARIYRFGNDGNTETFIGSADPSARPLSRNVEVLVPVRGEVQKDVNELLRVQLDPRRGAWEMDARGDYRRRASGSDADAQTQMLLRAQRAQLRARLR